jgi:hypothetical protein
MFQLLPTALVARKITESMKHRFAVSMVLGILASASGFAAEQKTVTGWVIDSACAFTKGLKKPISVDCAVSCAKNGSPLVILQDDGSIYWPIAETMPAEGQNKRLMPFAGKRVTASGKTYIRGGSTAIVIDKIAEAGSN